ncbi:MAG: phycocyanobilin:ferredoxin oxidoreductase [Calothrix sp. MO_167.B12]|nr:phycocyanobilin:ferredoxin oxidoreductase [Calothrix sp. MO_167.B12]
MVAIVQSSLRQRQHPLIRELANCIESHWQDYLTVSPYQIPEDLGYVEGSLEGEKLIIENHCYQTPQFRKLHLELAQVGTSLDILHCVMFPHTNYSLPIFGVDIVAHKGGIGAAIVDLSPVNRDVISESLRGILPASYRHSLANLPTMEFSQPRDLPPWGNIFSEFCLFIRPVDNREQGLFLAQVQNFLRLHCQIAISTSPVLSGVERTEIIAGQRYYCTQQQKNDKTRRVLEKSLGKVWTERYLQTMLFDAP